MCEAGLGEDREERSCLAHGARQGLQPLARCGDRPLLSVPVLGNKPFAIATAGVLAFLALAVHAPPLQAVFSTEAIRASDWLFILALAAAVILADELAKPFLAEPAAAGPAVAPASRTGEAGASWCGGVE